MWKHNLIKRFTPHSRSSAQQDPSSSSASSVRGGSSASKLDESETGSGGGDVVTAAPAAVQKLLERNSQKSSLRERLSQCFLEINPTKVGEVDQLLQRMRSYLVSDVALFHRLCVKYQSQNCDALSEALSHAIVGREILDWMSSVLQTNELFDAAAAQPALLCDLLRDGQVLCRLARLGYCRCTGDRHKDFFISMDNVLSFLEWASRSLDWPSGDALFNVGDLVEGRNDALVLQRLQWVAFRMFELGKTDYPPPLSAIYDHLYSHSSISPERQASDEGTAGNKNLQFLKTMLISPDPAYAIVLLQSTVSTSASPAVMSYEFNKEKNSHFVLLSHPTNCRVPVRLEVCVLQNCLVTKVNQRWELVASVAARYFARWGCSGFVYPYMDALPQETLPRNQPQGAGELLMSTENLANASFGEGPLSCGTGSGSTNSPALGYGSQPPSRPIPHGVVRQLPLEGTGSAPGTAPPSQSSRPSNAAGSASCPCAGPTRVPLSKTRRGAAPVDGSQSFVQFSEGSFAQEMSPPQPAAASHKYDTPVKAQTVDPSTEAGVKGLIIFPQVGSSSGPPSGSAYPPEVVHIERNTPEATRESSTHLIAHDVVFRQEERNAKDVRDSAPAAPPSITLGKVVPDDTSAAQDYQDHGDIFERDWSHYFSDAGSDEAYDLQLAETTRAARLRTPSTLTREISGTNSDISQLSTSDLQQGVTLGDEVGVKSVRIVPKGSQIGKGSVGIVFSGLNMDDGHIVAVKVIPLRSDSDPAKEAEVEREVALNSTVHHKNVIRLFGVAFTDSNCICLAMEYASGGTLFALIRKYFPIPIKLALKYIAQIADGLSHLHSLGIIHTDLKPSNILVRGDGTVAIADFGCSRSIADVAETSALVGTPPYMSPEMVNGVITKKSDVWAFACCVGELLTGKMPWYHLDLTGIPLLWYIGERTENAEPFLAQDLKHVDKEMLGLLQMCFQLDPASRPEMQDIIDALKVIIQT